MRLVIYPRQTVPVDRALLTDFAPVILALCDLVAGLLRRWFGVPTSGISISAALMIASRLELVGAEIDALRVLYCGFD
jgi:hypothetical protein